MLDAFSVLARLLTCLAMLESDDKPFVSVTWPSRYGTQGGLTNHAALA